jgi:hypothetical protein
MACLHAVQSRFGHEDTAPAPVTEPVVISTAFITEMVVQIMGAGVQMTGLELTQSIGAEQAERRIVTRIAMSDSTARVFVGALRRALARRGH